MNTYFWDREVGQPSTKFACQSGVQQKMSRFFLHIPQISLLYFQHGSQIMRLCNKFVYIAKVWFCQIKRFDFLTA
jgi:hypothetical protein